MGLFGIVIASLINMFMHSNAIMFVTSILGVIIFSFMTAYETQNLKSIYYQAGSESGATDKVAVFGALGLYLNFINLFIRLLYFFGDRRN
jgi:FtsH-binding integral membrane protein